MTDKYGRSQWFRDARFGMFIHWGAYAVPARGEWVRSVEQITVEDYQPHVDAFLPDDFKPEQWADLAAEAGMKYAVLTAKHHDGFALFDSALSTYTSMHNGAGRDFVREFLEAFRARGIKVGLYFSLLDWKRDDYPHFGDPHHPMRNNPEFKDHTPNLDTYVEFMHGQVRELCTNYGELDLLWFDFSYENMRAETWKAAELMAMVKELQPNVLTDNRLETSGDGHGSLVTDAPTPYAGDFVSPEQLIPPEGIVDPAGNPVPWEACITMNNNWGFHSEDHLWKDSSVVIRKLVECTAKSGNLLVNVGPDASGRIPQETEDRLRAVGTWLKSNGESIYGASSAGLDSPEWGYYTRKGETLFAHILLQPVGPLALTGGLDPESIGSITFLADGAPLQRSTEWLTEAYPDIGFVAMGPVGTFTYPCPDPVDTVVAIVLHLQPEDPAAVQ